MCDTLTGMLDRICLWTSLAAVLGALCLHASPSYAAEHLTLRNGFELVCDHRGALDPETGRLRLFLDTGSANYLDVAPGEIRSSEPVAVERQAVAQKVPAAQPSQHDLTADELHTLLATNGQAHDLSVDLLASVVAAESGGRVRAASPKGAQGLMQLMPSTAAQLGVTDALRPDQNVQGGTTYLDSLLRRYHDDLALALAAYNAGPGAVDRYHGVPPFRETRLYVARIIREFNRRYDAAQRNSSPSAAQVALGAPGRIAPLQP
jgi:soluble lytic murein transglycosylase-like protein